MKLITIIVILGLTEEPRCQKIESWMSKHSDRQVYDGEEEGEEEEAEEEVGQVSWLLKISRYFYSPNLWL